MDKILSKIAWTHKPEARDKTIKQFMETGGMPPAGIELISRYHNLDRTGGFAILESTNVIALANYALDWNGLIKMEIRQLWTTTLSVAFLVKNLADGELINEL